MSLQLAAQHLAQHGRGDDKMLVHMTPKEVSGLQHLAQMHGGSLTKNPHTGLPEAGFLDSIMPAIIGGAAVALTGGAITPLMAGLGVGAIQTARTGNLGAGIMAGLGAYGGAGLASGLMGAGAAAEGLGAQAAANAASETSGLTGAASNQAAQQAVADRIANLTPMDKLSAGISNLGNEQGRSLALNALGGGWNAAQTGLAAVSPVVADQMVQTTTPAPTRKGQIHPFRYDDGQFTRLNVIDADKFQGFAGGGFATVGNDGAAAPNPASGPAGQLAFNNEPVMRMAGGGRIEDGVHRFDLGGDIASAYQSGDIGAVNDLIANNQLTQSAVQDMFPTFDMSSVNPNVSFFNASAAPDYTASAPASPAAPAAPPVAAAPVAPAAPTDNFPTIPSGITGAQILSNYSEGQPVNLTAPGASQFASNVYTQPSVTDNAIIQYLQDNGLVGPGGKYDAAGIAAAEAKYGVSDAQVQQAIKDYDNSYFARQAQAMFDRLHPASTTPVTPVIPTTPITPVKPTTPVINAVAPVPGTSNVTQTILPTNPGTNAPTGTKTPYGNVNNPGDIIINPDGSKTIVPDVPGRPYGGFSGISELTNAYTAGGGHTGPANLYVPKTVEELNAKYPMSGGSKQIMDYLTGKTTENPILHPYTPTGQISKDYASSVLGYPEQDKSQKVYLFDSNTKKYIRNPDYIPTTYDTTTGSKVYGKSLNQIRMDFSKNANMSDAEWLKYITDNHIEPQQIADATGVSLGEVLQHIQVAKGSGVGSTSSSGVGSTSNVDSYGGTRAADGGLMAFASGGLGDLGSYSDGGRLLRGPGDGVSDSIPATIGKGRPARLADGEFVVPARIVSELGNGSTEAGARKLYAMMDRVQATRGKTIGKGKVATNTRADKFLPA